MERPTVRKEIISPHYAMQRIYKNLTFYTAMVVLLQDYFYIFISSIQVSFIKIWKFARIATNYSLLFMIQGNYGRAVANSLSAGLVGMSSFLAETDLKNGL